MIELKLNDKLLNVPSNWNDVTYEHYCQIVKVQGMPFIERLAIYTGIETEVCHKLNMQGIAAMIAIVEFMDFPDAVNEFAHPYKTDLKISNEPYEKLGVARMALKSAVNPIEAAKEIIKTYTGEDISKEPITKVMSQITFFLSSLESSLSDTSA